MENFSNIPILDTHAHLIFPDKIEYLWKDALPEMNVEKNEKMYFEKYKSLPIKGLIFMEVASATYLEEAKLLENLSEINDSKIKGIIAHVPMDKDINYIEQYLLDIGHKKLVGVRYLIQTFEKVNGDIPEFNKPHFYEKLKLFEQKSLPFHIGIYQEQLPYAIQLVKDNKNIKFLIDHLGKPFNGGEDYQFWAENVRILSGFPNVIMKLTAGFNYPQNFLAKSSPYIEYCVDCFGDKRLIIGSDAGFGDTKVIFDDWVEELLKVFVRKNLSYNQVENILFKNAEEIYSIQEN